MKYSSLKARVHGQIKQKILTGEIQSGQRLTELAVAKQSRVSRTPVREALQQLAQEGFLVSLPRAGFMVSDMSDDDITDLFSTRTEIEKIAAVNAVKFITVEELKLLDDTLETMGSAIKSGNPEPLSRLDVNFHMIIYKASRSRSLFRILKNLSDLTMRYRHCLPLSGQIWQTANVLHIDIYKALISKNPVQAAQAVEKHGHKTIELMLTQMKKIRSDAFSHQVF